jgi:hypothetical protein
MYIYNYIYTVYIHVFIRHIHFSSLLASTPRSHRPATWVAGAVGVATWPIYEEYAWLVVTGI